ncbi:hypothetical protein [uncultured Clostridium sp.]|uniref:hypothetical protein n=1 Tax=uncultured Clostridium sp. TaxID=59620 RepID=UPI0025DF03AE|nr:hypothetical protein [uncultured Clostridium sp.]
MSTIDNICFKESISESKHHIDNALSFNREVHQYKEKAKENLLNGMDFSNISRLEKGIDKINTDLSNDLEKVQRVLENILNNEFEINSGSVNKMLK